nr:uncharacterized protein LOC127310541 [Lolium perenne]
MASGDPAKTPARRLAELAHGGDLGGSGGRAASPTAGEWAMRDSRMARGRESSSCMPGGSPAARVSQQGEEAKCRGGDQQHVLRASPSSCAGRRRGEPRATPSYPQSHLSLAPPTLNPIQSRRLPLRRRRHSSQPQDPPSPRLHSCIDEAIGDSPSATRGRRRRSDGTASALRRTWTSPLPSTPSSKAAALPLRIYAAGTSLQMRGRLSPEAIPARHACFLAGARRPVEFACPRRLRGRGIAVQMPARWRHPAGHQGATAPTRATEVGWGCSSRAAIKDSSPKV